MFEDLLKIFDECREPNWDGYGAEPVREETYRLAQQFLTILPLGTRVPSIGAEPDGHITLEWYRSSQRTLSVSISPDGELHYAALLGAARICGTETFRARMSQMLSDLIARHRGAEHGKLGMKRTLLVLNELERGGVIERYAIGGAMGATFYVEPLLTFDLDVFVILPQSAAADLLSLAPLYEALRARGYTEEGECVLIEGVPVQFLPAYNSLLDEALREARETSYEDAPTRVVRAEHLIAICLQTGRDKDRERVRIFREQAELDMSYLASVLQRHGLEGKWKQWTP